MTADDPEAPGAVGVVRFLYVGVADTEGAVDWYRSVLGARVRWRFQHFGADVAGLDGGPGPLLLLADHRPPGTVLPIYECDDLDAVLERAQARGADAEGPVGTPEGPVVVVRDPDGAEHAFLRVERPDAMDGAYADRSNTHRVDGAAGP